MLEELSISGAIVLVNIMFGISSPATKCTDDPLASTFALDQVVSWL